jgi:hypothetical protein
MSVADRSRLRRRREWLEGDPNVHQRSRRKGSTRKLGRGANQLMTAERASRSDVLRAAGDVTAKGRGRAMRQTTDRKGTTLDVNQKARGRHDSAVPCRDEMIIASLSRQRSAARAVWSREREELQGHRRAAASSVEFLGGACRCTARRPSPSPPRN